MALIKQSHFPYYRDFRHTGGAMHHTLSWMTRSPPGIKWRTPMHNKKS